MKSFFVGSMIFAAFAFAQAPATDPVVLTIGTEKITKSMFENIIDGLNEQQKAQLAAQPEAKRGLAENIAELKMMAQEARVRRLDQSAAIQTKIVLQSETVLAQAVYQDMLKAKPAQADVDAYYKEHEKDWSEAKGRHILVRFTDSRVPPKDGKELNDAQALDKAKALRVRLTGGAPFADVAKAESDDVGSGENGGDLGSFAPGQMVEEFDKVAFEIPVGQVSEPVKSAFGYHLILIESRGAKKLDDVRTEIEAALQPELGAKAVEALKAKAAIVFNDDYFKPAAAPVAPAPAN